jgi:hypothetical protein
LARPLDGLLGERSDRNRSLDNRVTNGIRVDPFAVLDGPPTINAAVIARDLHADPCAVMRTFPKPGPHRAGRRGK